MKTLKIAIIFILLKIGETLGSILLIVLFSTICILLLDWLLTENAENWLRWLTGTLTYKIITYPIIASSVIYWSVKAVKNFKGWIEKNKEWSEKIYNKLKK